MQISRRQAEKLGFPNARISLKYGKIRARLMQI
jgi:hypothetical protein